MLCCTSPGCCVLCRVVVLTWGQSLDSGLQAGLRDKREEGVGVFELGVQLACLSYVVACGAVQRSQQAVHVLCRWDGCSQQGPSIQVGRSECGNLQLEDRNGVGMSRDGQGSDNGLGGVARRRNRTRQAGELVASKRRYGTARNRNRSKDIG